MGQPIFFAGYEKPATAADDDIAVILRKSKPIVS